MAEYREPIPGIPIEFEALYRELLIEDLVDLKDIKSKRRRKSYRAKLRTYIDKIRHNDPEGLLTCYGLDILANILRPQYIDPILEAAEDCLERLRKDVDDLQDKSKKTRKRRHGTGTGTYLDTGPMTCSLLYFLVDKVMPEYREPIREEAEALFRGLIIDLDELQDKPKKKRRKRCRKRKQDRPCVEDISSFEKNDVKPRGKIPREHAEKLRKNYPSIMENIQVNNIVDDLFSAHLIDWNEMDVIATKLKSEGNREALRYIMKVVFNSSSTGFPKFLSCLRKTGYSDLANNLLKGGMDPIKPSAVNDV